MSKAYDALVVVSKEAEDDFLWRCTICGQTGRGSKSEAKHVKLSGLSGSHGLKNIKRYVPELRYEAAIVRLGETQAENEKLCEQLPEEDELVFDEDDLREVIGQAVNACYVDEFEQHAAFGNEHGQTIHHIERLVLNDTWWAGFRAQMLKLDPRRDEDE